MDLLQADFSQVTEAVQSKKISAVETTQFFLNRVHALDKQLNSFTHISSTVLKEAELLDQKIARKENVGPLAGVVFGIKDLLCTKGMPSTAASKMLSGFVPPYDATVVSRLKNAGAIILGKLNQDEFAMGSSNETSVYGICHNPWDTTRVPGGSSGGSAAAQAARLAMATIGTDTGGSIRQPASFCGVVGVKPTYGRVSRYGIIAYASSLDQAGPIVSSVKDAALTLETICGQDAYDGTTSDHIVEKFSQNLNGNIKGKKIGVIKEFISHIPDERIAKSFQLALDTVKQLGAEIVEVSIPLTQYAVPMYYLISASEASSNFARYDGVKYGYRTPHDKSSNLSLDEFYSLSRGEGFGAEVKRRIMLGTYALSAGYSDAFYLKACKVRRLLRQQFLDAFEKCDVIMGPVTTAPAFKLGEKSVDPLKNYLNDIFTTSTNLCGLPGMSVPFSSATEGSVTLPIGVQLTAPHFHEQSMLNFAYALENTQPAADFRKLKPHVY